MSEIENKMPSWYPLLSGTDEQVEAITSDKYLTVVSAGAGTGKTHTLAQRFAWLLASDPECSVDKILVLTFTEKAAREMQERIKSTVTEWYERYPKDLAHLHRSIQFIDDAYISTIHSFSMKVIRESGLVLNIDPAAGIVPAPKEDVWWSDFSDALSAASVSRLSVLLSDEWTARAEEVFNCDHFVDFVNAYGPDVLSKTAKKASEIFGSSGRDPEYLWNFSGEELAGSIEGMSGFANDVWELWHCNVFPSIREFLYDKPGKSFEKLRSIAVSYENSMPDEENIKLFVNELLNVGLEKLPGNSKLKTEIEKVLGLGLKDWRDAAKLSLLKSSNPTEEEKCLSKLLNRTSALGWQCWEALKQKDGILSMSDLIRYAGYVLRSSMESRKKFRHILIDEFQDTDPLQDGLIDSLWVKPGDSDDFHNTLFIVGDLKQSIYRFRHADLKLFHKYITLCKEHNETGMCKYVTLDRSFRTREALLDGFNAVFSDIWKSGIEDMAIPYEPLLGPEEAPWWKDRNKEEIAPAMEALVSSAEKIADEKGNETGKREKISDARLRLYLELGRRIIDIKGRGAKVWNKSEKQFEAVQWKDFAILVPTRNAYSEIEKAFDDLGIPYVLCTNRSYFARGEIADLVNLVSLLAEPSNPLYLAGWLASPFSCTEAETAERCLAEANALRVRKKPLPLAEVVMKELPGVWAMIMSLRKTAMLRGVASMILDILKAPSFMRAYDPEQRKRVNANIVYLSDLAAEYEYSQGKSLVGCAAYMQSAVSSMQQKEEPDVASTEQDAVQVMTIHASKGLEFPIVSLSGTDDNRSKSDSINVSGKYGIIAKRLPDFMGLLNGNGLTVSGAWFDDEEEKAAKAERERLWYVGVTRARDKLILCGTLKEKSEKITGDSFLERVISACSCKDGKNVCDVSYLRPIPYEREKKQFSAQDKISESRSLMLKTVSPAKLARLSASAYAMLSWCPTAYRVAYRQGRSIQWTVKGGEGGSGSEFGSLAHWILARWDFKKLSIEKWLPEQNSIEFENVLRRIPFELRAEFKSADIRKELHAILSEYAESEEGKNLAQLACGENSKKLHRETAFRVQDGDLLLVGATDIFWEDSDGLHLRDWKTTAEEFAPSEYYTEQLMFYSYAIWKYMCEKKHDDILIDANINYLRGNYLKNNKSIISKDLLLKYGLKIHKAAEIALSGIFEQKDENCICCPWKNDCIKSIK